MICRNCNGSIPDDSVFCPLCGARIGGDSVPYEAESPSPYEAENPAPYEEKSPVPYEAETSAGASGAEFSGARRGKMSGALKKGIIAATVLAVVLIVVLSVGFATNWFGAAGPLAKLASAVEKTLTADNMTVELSASSESYYGWRSPQKEKIKGSAKIVFNPDERKIVACGKGRLSTREDSDRADFAIYDGYFFGTDEDGDYYCEDIAHELDEFFDGYEEASEKTGDDFSFEDFYKEYYGDDDYEDACEYVDFEALDKCFSSFVKKLNSEKWLKKNAGFSKRKEGGMTLYCFKPDIIHLGKVGLEEFEDAFARREDYRDAMEELEEAEDDFEDEVDSLNCELVFGIKSGKLVKIEYDYSVKYSDEEDREISAHMELNFKDIGSTEIDTDDLDDRLDKARNRSRDYDYDW